MSTDDWELLCSYDFGMIIFPKSRLSAPLPCMIADGDLDGDEYFVLFDEKILNHLLHSKDKLTSKSRKLLRKLELPAGSEQSAVKKTSYLHTDNSWLSKAQNIMLDFSAQDAGTRLVGKLFNLCGEVSTKDEGKIDIYDSDAVAFAKAYKDAIDIQKHGGKVPLPKHLHEKVPKSQQQYLLTVNK